MKNTYKDNNKKIRHVSIIILVLISVIFGKYNSTPDEVKIEEDEAHYFSDEIFEGYREIEVYGGDQSGERKSNVVVDIGFGDRKYWGFTNEYGQLIMVIAKTVVLQDERNEYVTERGRYYPDEAFVPGTETKKYDQGHVIADALGGVANAYNITPQEHILNTRGEQAYMEHTILKAGGCTNFVALISYPDNQTQIPSKYKITYNINGNQITTEFRNEKPETMMD